MSRDRLLALTVALVAIVVLLLTADRAQAAPREEAGIVGSISLDASTKRAAYCDSPLVRVGGYPGPWWWVAT